jgi:DNA-binding GntR family transcriptional regulator
MTTAFLDGRLPDLERHLEGNHGPISAMLERVYNVRIGRIEQSIQAIALGKRQAKLLKADPGSPALLATRRYYREDGTLIELSRAIHPSDRFTYVTSLVRG